MNNNNNNPGEKQAEIYTYEAPWLIYACNWSVRFVISVLLLVHRRVEKIARWGQIFLPFSLERWKFVSNSSRRRPTMSRRCLRYLTLSDLLFFFFFFFALLLSHYYSRMNEWMNNNNKNRYGAIKNYASGLDLSSRSTKIKWKSSRWTKRLVNS